MARKLLAWASLIICIAVVLSGLGVAMWLLGDGWHLPLLLIGMLALFPVESFLVCWIDKKCPRRGLRYMLLCAWSALGGLGISGEVAWWYCHRPSAIVVHVILAGAVGAVFSARWLWRMAKAVKKIEEDR